MCIETDFLENFQLECHQLRGAHPSCLLERQIVEVDIVVVLHRHKQASQEKSVHIVLAEDEFVLPHVVAVQVHHRHHQAIRRKLCVLVDALQVALDCDGWLLLRVKNGDALFALCLDQIIQQSSSHFDIIIDV